jgi:hypothetical protein
VFESLTAEFATSVDGRPVTVPVTPFYDRERDRIVVTAAPAFAGKAERAVRNPRVSILLHDATTTDRLHVTGRATVRDDDLTANAAVVERLLRAEPASPKRRAMVAAVERLQTRLGLLALDWYGLRILIDVEPTGVERDAAGSTTVSPWSAAGVTPTEAARYDRGVATVDDDGTPRTWPLGSTTVRDGRLRLEAPAGVTLTDGRPVCVLVHWHDDALDSFEQRLVRGRVRRVDGTTWVDPGSAVHHRNRTPLDRLRFVVAGKRRTRAYFATRAETYRPWPPLRRLLFP